MASTSIPAVWERGEPIKRKARFRRGLDLFSSAPPLRRACRAPTKRRYWGVARKDLGATMPPLGWAPMVDPDGAYRPWSAPTVPIDPPRPFGIIGRGNPLVGLW